METHQQAKDVKVQSNFTTSISGYNQYKLSDMSQTNVVFRCCFIENSSRLIWFHWTNEIEAHIL